MTNQKSNDSDKFAQRMQELADFFKETQTEPIYIDPNDSKSVDKGFEEVRNRIQSRDTND